RETVELDHARAGLLSRSGGQEERLVVQELCRCLATLPPDQRHILLMITVEGVSYAEASQKLGVAVGTLKCRVFRARRQLRVALLGQDDTLARWQTKELPAIPLAEVATSLPAPLLV
ncbi:MAG: sigma factor-like helix-turn-helix DNA-binding protein, partial [Roseococcus sp.]